MKLSYYNVNSDIKFYDRKPEESFIKKLKLLDKNLDVAFNRVTGFWEIYRLSEKGWQWILQVENDNGTYRPLDNRTLKKLWEMDVIARWGSIDNFEKQWDAKHAKWKSDKDKTDNHIMKTMIKEDRVLWQEAAENLRSGRL